MLGIYLLYSLHLWLPRETRQRYQDIYYMKLVCLRVVTYFYTVLSIRLKAPSNIIRSSFSS